MNENVSYILNLSEQFNAGNYLYYFLPGIAGGKILLFDELTKNQFPADNTTQEKELIKRIRKLKNHWQFYQLNPDNPLHNLKINIVIDSALWHFTGFGEYSRFPYVKLYVIKKYFEQFFSKQELPYIQFQFFVLKNENNDVEEFIAYIDEKKGFLRSENSVDLGTIDTNLLNWPAYTDVQHLIEKNYNTTGKINDDMINDELKNVFEKDISEVARIIESKMKSRENAERYQRFIKNRMQSLIRLFAKEIVKIQDLNNTEKKKRIITKFFKTFSSVNYLRKNKDILLRFSIDNRSVKSKIYAFEALTALLVESVDFFGQDSHVDFLSGGGTGQLIFDVTGVEFDEEIKKELFEDYLLFSREKESAEKLYAEKRSVKHFELNDEINPKEHLKVDENKIQKFIHVNYIDKEIPYFYSKQAIKNFKAKLEDNSIDELEKHIQLQLEKINTSHLLEGDYGVATSTHNLTYKEIEFQLQELKDQEKNDRLLSEVDYQKYRQEKNAYKKEITNLNQTFIDSLGLLPHAGKTLLFIGLGVFVLFLFFAPLYHFDYWKKALIYSGIFLAFLLLGALLFLNVLRGQIKNKLKDIFARNTQLVKAFNHYVTTLKELAGHIRESTVRRMNIKALEKVFKIFKTEENQIKIYRKFYSNIVTQLKRNGYDIQETQKVIPEPDYRLPPYLDYRIKKEREMKKFVIKYKASTRTYPKPNEKFISILGIVTKIELK